jgi:hypothetical protein
MSNGGEGGLKPSIEVILHEYDGLRNEIVSRMDARFQLIGFLGIAATILGATELSSSSRWVLIIIALAVFAGIWFIFGLYVARCAQRLRDIETWVNGELGEKVLTWESSLPHGGFYSFIRGRK